MPFTERTVEFLAINKLNDSKQWYEENKQTYKKFVQEPLLQLSEHVCGKISKIDPLMTLEPKKTISRVRRDTRFTKDKSLYRDVAWIVFRRGSGMSHPAFYVEFSPRRLRYGCGYYAASPAVMERMRQMVLNDDKRFLAAEKAMKKRKDMILSGEEYKRPKYPNEPERKRIWLDKKEITLTKTEETLDLLFSPELGDTLAQAFLDLKDFYLFLLAVHTQEDEGV